jgi:hypothetical protein
MYEKSPAYVHLLLYQCQRCDEPIAISVKSDEANPEGVDGDLIDVPCKCGSVNKSFGAEAKCHWVASWESSSNLERPRLRMNGTEGLGTD